MCVIRLFTVFFSSCSFSLLFRIIFAFVRYFSIVLCLEIICFICFSFMFLLFFRRFIL